MPDIHSETDHGMPANPKITVLLPYYPDIAFAAIFESFGFDVLSGRGLQGLCGLAETCTFDVAIEWQHGPQDFPMRDVLRGIRRPEPVLLSLNWNGSPPANFARLGYAGTLAVPFDIDNVRQEFAAVLPPERAELLRPRVLSFDLS